MNIKGVNGSPGCTPQKCMLSFLQESLCNNSKNYRNKQVWSKLNAKNQSTTLQHASELRETYFKVQL